MAGVLRPPHTGNWSKLLVKRVPPLAVLTASLFFAACAARGPAERPADPVGAAPEAEHQATGDHAGAHHAATAHVHAADAGAHAHGLPATAGAGFTVADVHFMQMMIGHHAQAIVMAGLAPERGASEMVLRLAEKIDISQRDEIAFMEQWLREREQVAPDSAQAHAMHMPGMLTPEQMVRLAAARNTEFDRLFLTLMIQHHEGALLMVDELFASPGAGQDPDLFRFVTDVAADQGDEIFVMQRMLDMLAAPASPTR
jgi:uncharacterized protein (DUF305 family)